MKIIIGLGNPGEKYKNNRHNAGFLFLDELQKSLNFPEFKFEKKFNAYISKSSSPLLLSKEKVVRISEPDEVILVKPQTFMNLSGNAVQAIMNFYKLTPSEVTIIHDDLDIEIGAFKVSNDSRAAGHNGVQSVFDCLGTQEIKRIRIGVEKENGRAERSESGEQFALKDFTKKEFEKLSSVFDKLKEQLKQL